MPRLPRPLSCFHKIHWQALHLVVQQLPLGMRTWRLKFASGCPLCGAPNEKASHVLSCPDAGATAKAMTFHSTTVRDHLQGCDTHPDLLTLIPKLLLCIQAGTPVCLHLQPAAVSPALRSQAATGWHNFPISQWSVDWFCLQHKHCLSAGSQKSALCWLSSTLGMLIQGQWHLWDFCN